MASLGPAFETVIVKVTVEPTNGVALSIILVIDMSDTGTGIVAIAS